MTQNKHNGSIMAKQQAKRQAINSVEDEANMA